MNFTAWLKQVSLGLGKAFDVDGAEYIKQTGIPCWRELYKEGLSPEEAVEAEVDAAATMQG